MLSTFGCGRVVCIDLSLECSSAGLGELVGSGGRAGFVSVLRNGNALVLREFNDMVFVNGFVAKGACSTT